MKKNKIAQPVHKGVAKVPVVMQLEALECGAASLTMLMAYYGTWIPLEQIRKDCGVSRDGSSAINIVKAARYYGFKAKGFRCEPEALRENGTFPCIIHWDFNHFVVLDGFKGNKVFLNDPAKGAYSIPMENFDESFTGICLEIVPGEDYVPSGQPKSMLSFAAGRLKNLKGPVILTVLTTVITSLLGIITPVFDRIFYDRLLTGKNPDWFIPFIIGLAVLYVVQLFVSWITLVSNYRIKGKLDLVGNLSYLWKVLHLPMHFFSQRMTGDIASRQQQNTNISNTLVDTLSPLVLNTAMMIFYLVIMIRYNLVLTAVGVASAIINLVVSRAITKRRINISRIQQRDVGKLSAITVSGIQMIETIKASGAEEGFFEKWSGHYAATNSTAQRFEKENQFLLLIPTLVSQMTSGIILGIGLYLTIKGQFSLGAIAAFQGFFSAFISPAGELTEAGQTIQTMRVDMERIDDIMEYPNDPNIADIEPKDGDAVEKLSGNIEIKNITFGYSPLDKPLIENFSMSVRRGSSVAFVGTSGCGKSTLSKLISGLYTPWSGDILFDGKHINEIDHGIFTGSLAVVDQDIIMFEDTIANNIKMWDDSIEDFEMILAAKDAQMHYDIVAKDGGYQHRLTEGGRDFSGGQRQRLEIARVLAQDPTIVILDEATSALDAKTEFDVVKAIRDRGITTVVIAHRLSTIRDCEEIIVLDQGKVVERGTHSELMKLNGYYARLVTND